ncbi:DUF1343 domain-containing protein [candidate division KSB1 bacterium]|nr:DUF1343 domain-containing protein [candidate division KSB1 bacterium]
MKRNRHWIIPLIMIAEISLSGCNFKQQPTRIIPGIDRLNETEYLTLFKDKKIGIITNQTGVNSDREHLADLLFNQSDVHLSAIFSPEHGFYGQIEGGIPIDMNRHEKYGCPIFSLYGTNRKPTADMLDGLDVLIFDIQDIGARFYTYISTMYYAMEAAAENNLMFVVLDRPNPVGGLIVEGPVLQESLASFVGIQPIPLRHGMTVGELALLFQGEGWYSASDSSDVRVIPLQNWDRRVPKEEFLNQWIKPSPNIPDLETAMVYPGMGLLEATNISEGRGTEHPFKYVGAPWLNNTMVYEEMMSHDLQGIEMDTITFTPVDIPGAAVDPKYEGERCFGLRFSVSDYDRCESVTLATYLIYAIKKLHPEEFKWTSEGRIDRMAGTDMFRESMDAGIDAGEIVNMWKNDLVEFEKLRKKYLLYH